MKKTAKKIYIGLVYFFLYLPILILIVFSFNNSKYSTNWTGFTLKWYVQFFKNAQLIDATLRSLLIAFLSSIAATGVGTLGAMAFYRYRFMGRKMLY